MIPEEICWGSLQAKSEEKEDEAVMKDTLEERRMEALTNLKRYQEETRAGRTRKSSVETSPQEISSFASGMVMWESYKKNGKVHSS